MTEPAEAPTATEPIGPGSFVAAAGGGTWDVVWSIRYRRA